MPELEDELRAAREFIAVLQRRLELELFDHGPNSTFLVDELGIIVRANAAAERAFGPVDALIERPLIELFEGTARDELDALLDSGEGDAHEIGLSNGKVVDISVCHVPNSELAQVSLRDVSTRVALTRELQHARRLASIGHLAAGVAHEINNPLAVLRLGLEELAACGELEHVPELLDHTDRIARIVANLQSFAEPRPPERMAVPVVELVARARQLARRVLDGIEIRVDIVPPSLALMVDRGQLEEAMTNLLLNAGRVLAGSGRIDISAHADAQRVQIQVSDSGPGIPEALLDHVFTPFVSAGEHMGMGLGLAITWGLVQENLGRIRAFNRPAGGACFELELPRAQAVAVAAPAPTPTTKLEGRGLRVLCVEDEEVLRRTLLRLLQVSGHQAVAVGSAEEGVERLADESFDLVISDVRLPGHDGEWLRRQVDERFPALRDRVLLISGFFSASSDAVHFLQKPFSVGQLQAAIASIVDPPERRAG